MNFLFDYLLIIFCSLLRRRPETV